MNPIGLSNFISDEEGPKSGNFKETGGKFGPKLGILKSIIFSSGESYWGFKLFALRI